MDTKTIINEATDRTRNILSTHRDQLEKIAEALLEKETLSLAELHELLGMKQEENEENSDDVSAEATADAPENAIQEESAEFSQDTTADSNGNSSDA